MLGEVLLGKSTLQTELANAGAKAVLNGGRTGRHRPTFRKVHSFIHTLIRTLVAVESLLERVCG